MTRPRASRPPAPPAHLSAASQAWWRQVVRAYVLEPSHLKVLLVCAESWDRMVQAREILERDGIVTINRFGQPVKHPAVQIEAESRLAFLRGLRELDLEGEAHPGYRRT